MLARRAVPTQPGRRPAWYRRQIAVHVQTSPMPNSPLLARSGTFFSFAPTKVQISSHWTRLQGRFRSVLSWYSRAARPGRAGASGPCPSPRPSCGRSHGSSCLRPGRRRSGFAWRWRACSWEVLCLSAQVLSSKRLNSEQARRLTVLLFDYAEMLSALTESGYPVHRFELLKSQTEQVCHVLNRVLRAAFGGNRPSCAATSAPLSGARSARAFDSLVSPSQSRTSCSDTG